MAAKTSLAEQILRQFEELPPRTRWRKQSHWERKANRLSQLQVLGALPNMNAKTADWFAAAAIARRLFGSHDEQVVLRESTLMVADYRDLLRRGANPTLAAVAIRQRYGVDDGC